MQTAIRTQSDARTALRRLNSDALLYRNIYETSSRQWTIEERKIRESLDALMGFKVSQPAPLLLALLRLRDEGVPRIGQLVQAFKTIENFHFQATAVVGQSSSGGITERYAKYARELTEAQVAQERADKIREFRDAMVRSLPDPEVVKQAFVENIVFTNEISRDKWLAQYVLQRIHESERPAFEYRSPTVEHLLPQSEIANGVPAHVVGSIGNLVWMSEDVNGQLANKSAMQKKRILSTRRDNYFIDDFLDAPNWGHAEIQARAEKMADLAVTKVWKLTAAATRVSTDA